MRRIGKKQLLWLSGGLIAVALGLKWTIGDSAAPVAEILLILSSILAGWEIAVQGIRLLFMRMITIDLLVTLAFVGAMMIGEYVESAAVTFLFLLGHYLESRTMERTRASIQSLLSLTPDTAVVSRNGEETVFPVNEVVKGDVVVIRPGMRIPVDGLVRTGHAYINQAAITGESEPVHKIEGDLVYSGTLVDSGYLLVHAERVGEDTTFSRIIALVEEAQDRKAKTQKFLDVFAKYYTPLIIVMTAAMYIFTRDLEMALTLLVIACPGALVISAPVSMVAGIGNGAAHGVLIKGGDIVEKLSRINVLALDKTGTLTEGKPKVTSIRTEGAHSEDELLGLIAAAETYSEHPLGRAIIQEAVHRGLQPLRVPEHTNIKVGMGVQAYFEGDRQITVGNRALLSAAGVPLKSCMETAAAQLEREGQTVIFAAENGELLGYLAVADQPREDARDLVLGVAKRGVARTVMLTGDREGPACRIAELVGVTNVKHSLLPEDKVQALRSFQGDRSMIGMVGDGVNDAPALAAADVGITLGGAGSDAAMETADVVLMSDELGKLAYAITLAKTTVVNMKQNIVFSVLVAGLLVAGVLGKMVFLTSGMLIHELSVLLVILNALRVVRLKPKPKVVEH